MKRRGRGGSRAIGLGRALFLAAMVGMGAATAGANGVGTTIHHTAGWSAPSTPVSHTASLINFGGSLGSGPTNVPVPSSGVANVGLGLNVPLLGVHTTSLGLPVLPGGATAHPGLLGAAPTHQMTLPGTGTLNLGLSVSVPALGLNLNPVVHVPSVTHVLGTVVSDVEGILHNPANLGPDLEGLLSTLLGIVSL